METGTHRAGPSRRSLLAKVVPFQSSLFDVAAEPVIELFPARPETGLSATPPPPDIKARHEALDIRRSFIVEAPAGSGKTGLLVQRMLKLLADASVTQPEQVLAITFTIKATAEMRNRVLAHLEAALRESLPGSNEFERDTRTLALAVLERDQQLGWSLLDHPQRLNIRTIDSVCSEIARSLPVLSGSGGHLAPVTDVYPLYREAARRTLLLLGSNTTSPAFDVALRDLLLHRDANLADCETLLADMLSLREQWGNLIPLAKPTLEDAWLDAHVLPRLQQALEEAICSGLAEVVSAFPQGLLTELADIASELGHAAPQRSVAESPIAACAGIRASPGADAADLSQWKALVHLLMTKGGELRKAGGLQANNLKFEYDKKSIHHSRLCSVLDALSERQDLLPVLQSIDELPPAEYPANQWALAKSLFRVLSRALVELQIVFAEAGQCDFTEITLLARAALEADHGVDDLASALGAKLQHLLADEMQDTSASQYDLVRLLTASWDGHSQTVFLVGDPRQSIYLFRQARVESFLETMRSRRLGELPLTPLRLTANFRSQQTLVEHFNHDFAQIFPSGPEVAAEALPYEPVNFVRPPSDYGEGLKWHGNPVEIRPAALLPQAAPTPARLRQRQAKRDAREMRRIVRQWLDKPLPPGRSKPWRIAVLVRNRRHLEEVVAEFDTADNGKIPYKAVDITPLAERPEILDLTALTRILLHPADRVAGFAVLRAPWCGLSLADLHKLAGDDDSMLRKYSVRRLMNDRGELLSEESIERMTRVWKILEGATAQRSRLTTAQLVERAWRSLGGDRWLSTSELTNARRFFELLDEMESEAGLSGQINPIRLIERLTKLYAEPATIAAGTPFVELLTIHNAKGLEWDVVLVPALERSTGAGGSRLLTWSELRGADSPESTGPSPVLLAPIAAKGDDLDPLTAWLRNLYKKREAAERKRLFYVASTRAREELHLFAAPDFTAANRLNYRWDSLLKAVLTAALPHFDTFLRNRSAIATLKPSLASGPTEPIAEPTVLDLDAASTRLGSLVQRLPLAFDPGARFVEARAQKLPYGEPDNAPRPGETLFSRPEGSFAARSFGNVAHESLDRLARALANGQTASQLLAELPSWAPSISALLRADGLPRATVERLARDTHTALENALRDPHGLWLLSPHPGAASEFALTAWPAAGTDAVRPASVRADRIFHGGSDPGSPGEDSLWIIDYKTSSHSAAGLEDFLVEQRLTYAPQLDAYARILAPAQDKLIADVRLALYFPMIPRLVLWKAAPES